MKSTKHEFIRFIFWGGINTLSGYLIYAFLLHFFAYMICYSISYCLSIFISYFLNSRFVFKERLRLRKALKYPLVYINQYLLGAVSLYLLVQFLKIDKLVAPLFVVLLTIPVTFFLSRRIVRGKVNTK